MSGSPNGERPLEERDLFFRLVLRFQSKKGRDLERFEFLRGISVPAEAEPGTVAHIPLTIGYRGQSWRRELALPLEVPEGKHLCVEIPLPLEPREFEEIVLERDEAGQLTAVKELY